MGDGREEKDGLDFRGVGSGSGDSISSQGGSLPVPVKVDFVVERVEGEGCDFLKSFLGVSS